jgi:CheY-like chemotaxis protein
VLLVADEALIGLQLEEALEGEGCQVVGVAGSVAEALDLLNDDRPDGALLDINLSGEKSFAVADRLVELQVPFVFCTGYAGHSLIPERFAGIPLLRKPFDVQEVAAIFAAKPTAEPAK